MNILQFANFVWWAELKALEHGTRLAITESFLGIDSRGQKQFISVELMATLWIQPPPLPPAPHLPCL